MKLPFKKIQLAEYDLLLLAAVLCLLGLGIVMVYSASSVMAAKNFHDGAYFLKRQFLFAILGCGITYVTMQTDYTLLKKWAVPLLGISLLLLVLVLIPGIGGKVKGASRWIRLPGFNLQPAEVLKITMIMYMAYSIEKKQDRIQSLTAGFLPYMLVLMVILGLLLKQPDMGSALTIGAVTILMLLAAGTRLSFLSGTALLASPLVVYLVVKSPYRLQRIKAFLNPEQDPTGSGWQIIQSKYAFGAGGFLGQGLGEGKQKLFYLPEAHTDFILSVVAEELGFLGVIVVIGFFFFLISRSMRVAAIAKDAYGRFLALGITVLFGIQASVNMCVVTGLVPTKGLALPFLSYGGSSLLMNMFAVGLLLSISRGQQLSAGPTPVRSRR